MKDKTCKVCLKTKDISLFPQAGLTCLKCHALAMSERRRSPDFVATKVSPEKSSWKNMKQRCNNPNNTDYDRYGGRGITVDPSWNEFGNFLSDMGHKPSADFTLERKNNDEGYNKDNCKWASRAEQSLNTSANQRVEHQGEVLTISQLSRITGVHDRTLTRRLASGKKGEELVSPVKEDVKYQYEDKFYSVAELSRLSGVNQGTLHSRLVKQGLPVVEAMTKPVRKKSPKKVL